MSIFPLNTDVDIKEHDDIERIEFTRLILDAFHKSGNRHHMARFEVEIRPIVTRYMSAYKDASKFSAHISQLEETIERIRTPQSEAERIIVSDYKRLSNSVGHAIVKDRVAMLTRDAYDELCRNSRELHQIREDSVDKPHKAKAPCIMHTDFVNGKAKVLHRSNGAHIGDFIVSDDGYYRFVYTNITTGGYWDGETLRSLGEVLHEINKPWAEQLKNIEPTDHEEAHE